MVVMMKAGPSTTAINPAPLTLSAATLLSRGSRAESQRGRKGSTLWCKQPTFTAAAAAVSAAAPPRSRAALGALHHPQKPPSCPVCRARNLAEAARVKSAERRSHRKSMLQWLSVSLCRSCAKLASQLSFDGAV